MVGSSGDVEGASFWVLVLSEGSGFFKAPGLGATEGLLALAFLPPEEDLEVELFGLLMLLPPPEAPGASFFSPLLASSSREAALGLASEKLGRLLLCLVLVCLASELILVLSALADLAADAGLAADVDLAGLLDGLGLLVLDGFLTELDLLVDVLLTLPIDIS